MSKKDSKTKDDDGVTVDMYGHLSRWDAILMITFIVAFLIFALAIFLFPQAV